MGFIVYSNLFDKYYESKHLFNKIVTVKGYGPVNSRRIYIDIYMTTFSIFKN